VKRHFTPHMAKSGYQFFGGCGPFLKTNMSIFRPKPRIQMSIGPVFGVAFSWYSILGHIPFLHQLGVLSKESIIAFGNI